jgi:hypothetical protein
MQVPIGAEGADDFGTMSASPPPDAESKLLALRQRLRDARAERGACPPWTELRDDLLPGGTGRAGRAERLAHKDLCPYCSEHVSEWLKSFDHASDTLGAIEKGVARGVVAGAKKLSTMGRRPDPPAGAPVPDRTPPPPPAPVEPATPTMLSSPPPRPPAPARPAPPPPRPQPQPRPAVAKPKAPAPVPARASRERPAPPPRTASPAPRPAAAKIGATRSAPAPGPIRLLVVEAEEDRRIPESVFLCAQAMGADVACVPRVESLAGDPDLDAVCAIVLAGARPAAEWPEAVRRAKDLAPGRPVVVLAPYDSETSSGARRALGAHLLAASDPAERLLVALDARLR